MFKKVGKRSSMASRDMEDVKKPSRDKNYNVWGKKITLDGIDSR